MQEQSFKNQIVYVLLNSPVKNNTVYNLSVKILKKVRVVKKQEKK